MKKLFLFSFVSFCFLTLFSCQNKVSPLELAVRDYAGDRWTKSLNDSIKNNDTLFLWAHFIIPEHWSYSSYQVVDSLYHPKVALSIGGTINRIEYPRFTRLLPPPPPPPVPDVIEQLQITDDESEAYEEEPSISTRSTQNQEYKVDSIEVYKWYLKDDSTLQAYETAVFGAPKAKLDTFQFYQEIIDHYQKREGDLYHTIDSLYLMSPELIGYTTFGRVHVIILAEDEVDKKYIDAFLRGVKVQDLRPRYIHHKKYEEEVYYCGWGTFKVYGIEQNGQFKQVGGYLID